MILGWRTFFKILISLVIRSTSFLSLILSFSRIFTATYYSIGIIQKVLIPFLQWAYVLPASPYRTCPCPKIYLLLYEVYSEEIKNKEFIEVIHTEDVVSNSQLGRGTSSGISRLLFIWIYGWCSCSDNITSTCSVSGCSCRTRDALKSQRCAYTPS
jgi:hypothetical protein